MRNKMLRNRDDNLRRSIKYNIKGWITVKKGKEEIATSFKHDHIKTHRNAYGITQVSIAFDEGAIAEIEFGRFKRLEKLKHCNGFYLYVE